MRADWPPYIWGEVGINPGARGDEDPRYATAEIGRPLRSAETAFHRVGLQGLRLSIALKYLVEPDIESKRKGASLVDGDVAAEIETRPSPRNLSRLLLPKKDFANSFSKELAEAQGAAPPPPPLYARTPSDFQWRVGKTSHVRPCGDERALQDRFCPIAPRLNAARMALHCPRIKMAGGLEGSRDKFGGFGAAAPSTLQPPPR